MFSEFDGDGSGTIDDAEWDQLVAVLRQRGYDRQQQIENARKPQRCRAVRDPNAGNGI